VENEIEKMKEEKLIDDIAYFRIRGLLFDLKAQLQDKIVDWETGMGEEDRTLYSLGLRHAIDLISGFNPTEEDRDG
jgi:hypothetical protein